MSSMRVLAVVLLVLAVAALAVGVVYFAVPISKLPALLGHSAHGRGHRTKRGIAALIAGAVLLIGSVLAFLRATRSRARY